MQENEEAAASHRAPVLKVFPEMFNLSRCVCRCQATDEAEEVGGSPQGTAGGRRGASQASRRRHRRVDHAGE